MTAPIPGAVSSEPLRILVADDEAVTRRILEATLSRQGFQVTSCSDGDAALAALTAPNGPSLAVLDWSMPGLSGPEVCERLRKAGQKPYVYVILLSARTDKADVIAGLDSGADDYLGKPFHPDELYARVRAGERTLHLQRQLERKVAELEEERSHVKVLQGLLSICMHCKSIRSRSPEWERIDWYLEKHSDVRFSHGICDHCMDEHHPD